MSTIDFYLKIKEKYPTYFNDKKILEIGSSRMHDENKFLFDNCNHLGIDDVATSNVDVVTQAYKFNGPDSFFDTIICSDYLANDLYYEETIENIIRMLKPGGLFIFTVSLSSNDSINQFSKKNFKKIVGFNQNFPDANFNYLKNENDIPYQLLFYAFKGGEKYLLDNVEIHYKKDDFLDHIFVIDSWPDNESKENDLLELIKTLKVFNITILLVGHYPIKPEIQKMVDYYIFDKNNPLLLPHEFSEHGIGTGRWTEWTDKRIDNAKPYHHDFAIWETMRNAFNFSKFLNKKYIHFLEYDNLINQTQYRQSFLEQIHNYDAIICELYDNTLTNVFAGSLCATYIFSIKTDIAIELISKINTKKEYFTNKPDGWNLEAVFYNNLIKITNKIKVSDYIDNDKTLNKQAVWNRDAISRNGGFFQIYLACDIEKKLYLHTISGFNTIPAEQDYLIEIEYDTYRKFVTIPKGEMTLNLIGNYKKGQEVKIYYLGVLVYYEFLNLDFINFYKINKLYKRYNNNNINQEPDTLKLNFIDGAYLEINDYENINRDFEIQFFDRKNNLSVYGTTLKNGWWCKTNLKFFIDYKIIAKSDGYYEEYDLSLKDKRVFISFESKSLGDNLAWIPYVEEFRIKHKCQVICSTFFNDLFVEEYKELIFVPPGSTVQNINALYRLGIFFNSNGEIDYERHPSDPFKIPLQKVASDILGLNYEELKPRLPKYTTNKVKRVCIAIHSTAQAKYWNNPTGWQEITDYLNTKGYEVRLLSREEDGYMGNKNPKGVIQQPKSEIKEIIKVINESELFIGIGSGLSWLAWGCDIPVILISGFSEPYTEPSIDINRIINRNVCNSCWNTHKFDAGDWNWCPLHKGTKRQFECSKNISSEMVINEIKTIL